MGVCVDLEFSWITKIIHLVEGFRIQSDCHVDHWAPLLCEVPLRKFKMLGRSKFFQFINK